MTGNRRPRAQDVLLIVVTVIILAVFFWALAAWLSTSVAEYAYTRGAR